MDRTLREAVLQLFTNSDHYLSGEAISRSLGCTRTAVWKQINELRRLGYAFDAKPRKGYRLVSRPDVLLPEEIHCFMKTKYVGQKIRFVEQTESTQHLAHEWAKEGAEPGSLVVADEQTSGKGRMGRHWHSPAGDGIWMSLLLKPSIPLVHTPHLTLLVSVAVTRALRAETGAKIGIKWPNDLLIKGRKVCGILTEVRAEADRIHYCVAGIGINVHTPPETLPPELKSIAVSLSEVTEKPLHRAQIVARCCLEIEKLLELYDAQGFSPLKSLWESHALILGKRITVSTADGRREGIAEGLDDSGALLLKTVSKTERIFSADVTLKSQ